MLPELKEAERDLNKEFKKKNKEARDGSWKSLKTAEQKAKADPKKYLMEAFPKGSSGRPTNLDIVVVKIGADERFAFSESADKMSLETVSVDAPWTNGKKPNPDRWLIIGRNRDAVWDQMREIEREAARSTQSLSKEKPSRATPAAKPVKESKTSKFSVSVTFVNHSPKELGLASLCHKTYKPGTIVHMVKHPYLGD